MDIDDIDKEGRYGHPTDRTPLSDEELKEYRRKAEGRFGFSGREVIRLLATLDTLHIIKPLNWKEMEGNKRYE